MDLRTRSFLAEQTTTQIINSMFYIWHTLIIATFVAVAFQMGYLYGKRQNKVKETIRKS